MKEINRGKSDSVGKLFKKLVPLLDKEPDREIGISALINLLIACFYRLALETGMDIEEFILYVNAILKEMKKSALDQNKLGKLR